MILLQYSKKSMRAQLFLNFFQIQYVNLLFGELFAAAQKASPGRSCRNNPALRNRLLRLMRGFQQLNSAEMLPFSYFLVCPHPSALRAATFPKGKAYLLDKLQL